MFSAFNAIYVTKKYARHGIEFSYHSTPWLVQISWCNIGKFTNIRKYCKIPKIFTNIGFLSILGTWLSDEMIACLQDLLMCGFRVRGLVTDNHPTNVAAFKIILEKFPGDRKSSFQLPNAEKKTYVFFDTVHGLFDPMCGVKNDVRNIRFQVNLSVVNRCYIWHHF